MSYDFLLMKPIAPIQSPSDLREETLAVQDPAATLAALRVLVPAAQWRQEADGGWFGSLDSEDGWYEFRIGPVSDIAWSIATSHRAGSRSLVPRICAALDLIAFDGQANELVRPGDAGAQQDGCK